MPVLFVGHGSPMNAIEENVFTQTWEKLGYEIPLPKAILSISAHWVTRGTKVNTEKTPQIIYDMYGFPQKLYDVRYTVLGEPEIAQQTKVLLAPEAEINNDWGIDHGTWSVLCKMYPKANIPTFQLGINYFGSFEEHYYVGKKLSVLREQGVLILGSGNVVHNLARVDFSQSGGFSWAEEFDEYIKKSIVNRQYNDVLHYEKAGACAELAFTTTEHFNPLLYVLGASCEEDSITVLNDACVSGSLSMTSYLFQ